MPVAPFQPEEFAHLLSDDWDEQRLNDFFKARPANRDIDYWLSRRLPPRTPREQLLWRTARAAHCFREEHGQAKLMVAIPGLLSGMSTLNGSQWSHLGQELQSSLSFKLSLEPGELELHSHPVSTLQAHAMGATGWSRLWAGIPDEHELHPLPGQPLPFVWFGVLSVSLGAQNRLEPFLRLTAGVAKACKEPLLRAEGLAEEKGVQLNLFPPTAAWNGPSFARLFGLRKMIAQLKGQEGFEARLCPGGVDLALTGKPTLHWQLPEEDELETQNLLKQMKKV